MEDGQLSLNAIELSTAEEYGRVSELSELELALIGGGSGDVIIQ